MYDDLYIFHKLLSLFLIIFFVTIYTNTLNAPIWNLNFTLKSLFVNVFKTRQSIQDNFNLDFKSYSIKKYICFILSQNCWTLKSWNQNYTENINLRWICHSFYYRFPENLQKISVSFQYQNTLLGIQRNIIFLNQ